MTGQGGAILRLRFAVPILLALIGAFGPGCAQLLGITDIAAAADGGTYDTASDGGAGQEIAGDEVDNAGDSANSSDSANSADSANGVADAAGDHSAADNVADRLSDDSESGADATSCSGDLSNVHTGDFLISFTMQTNQTEGYVGLVNQRTVCVGVGLFWDAMLVNQHIRLELSESTDQSRYATLVSSGAALNDNAPHAVVITRTSGVVKMMVDDRLAGSQTMNQNQGPLPKLRTGNGACPGVAVIREALTNVCVRPN
jgi:hypothetical protein